MATPHAFVEALPSSQCAPELSDEEDIFGYLIGSPRPGIQQPRCHDNQTCCRQYPVSLLFQIINFDTFGGEADLPNHLSMVRMAMPHNWPNSSVPEPVKDQKPADDFFASRLADQIRMDAWRKKLTMIRGEILEIAEHGSQQGLVALKRETVELARTLERLEALLGLSNK